MKVMTVLGVGPKWAACVLSYGGLATWVSVRYSVLRIPDRLSLVTTILGVVLLAIGVVFYAIAGRAIIKGFPTGQLLTRGAYRICRHPVYGSWILFIIPGIELLLRSCLGLSTCLVGYVLLRIMARDEEAYLAEKFGNEYTLYRQRTPFVLPVGFLGKRQP